MRIIKQDSYKAGDRVLIVPKRTLGMSSTGSMDKYLNTVMTIARGCYQMKEDKGYWSWTDSMIAGKVDDNEYQLYRIGDTVEVLNAGECFAGDSSTATQMKLRGWEKDRYATMNNVTGQKALVVGYNDDMITHKLGIRLSNGHEYIIGVDGVKLIDRNDFKYRIGDTIRVSHAGNTYPTYRSMAVEMNLRDWEHGQASPKDDDRGEVIAIGIHEHDSRLMYGIRVNGVEHMIGEGGIELVVGDEVIPNCEFRLGDKVFVSDNTAAYIKSENYAEMLKLTEWNAGVRPDLGTLAKVVSLMVHPDRACGILAGIRCDNGHEYVINIRGLSKIDYKFEIGDEVEKTGDGTYYRDKLAIKLGLSNYESYGAPEIGARGLITHRVIDHYDDLLYVFQDYSTSLYHFIRDDALTVVKTAMSEIIDFSEVNNEPKHEHKQTSQEENNLLIASTDLSKYLRSGGQ